METMEIVKQNFEFSINDVLLQIFFEENEEILNLKFNHQYNLTGTFYYKTIQDN